MSPGQAPHSPVDDDDLWHVHVDGEVKVLTLDQLDDLYRLDIISGSTNVWQPGMDKWLPLSVVAGFDDDDDDDVIELDDDAIEESTGVRSSFATGNQSLAALAAQSVAAKPQPASVPPPRSVPPPSMAPRAAAPAAAAPSFAPQAAVRPQNPALRGGPGWVPAIPDSLRPVASPTTAIVYSTERRLGAFSRGLLTAAGVAGFCMILFRNDVLRDFAQSTNQMPLYERLEAYTGPPGFGSPRSIETLTESTGAKDIRAPELTQNDTADDAASKTATADDKSDADDTATGNAKQGADAQAKADADKPEGKAKQGDKDDGLGKALGNAMSGGPATLSLDALPKEGNRAKRPAPSKKGKSSGKDLGFKGSNLKYDPLNGNL